MHQSIISLTEYPILLVDASCTTTTEDTDRTDYCVLSPCQQARIDCASEHYNGIAHYLRYDERRF